MGETLYSLFLSSQRFSLQEINRYEVEFGFSEIQTEVK